MTFKDLKFEDHPNFPGSAWQAKATLANDLDVSVVHGAPFNGYEAHCFDLLGETYSGLTKDGVTKRLQEWAKLDRYEIQFRNEAEYQGYDEDDIDRLWKEELEAIKGSDEDFKTIPEPDGYEDHEDIREAREEQDAMDEDEDPLADTSDESDYRMEDITEPNEPETFGDLLKATDPDLHNRLVGPHKDSKPFKSWRDAIEYVQEFAREHPDLYKKISVEIVPDADDDPVLKLINVYNPIDLFDEQINKFLKNGTANIKTLSDYEFFALRDFAVRRLMYFVHLIEDDQYDEVFKRIGRAVRSNGDPVYYIDFSPIPGKRWDIRKMAETLKRYLT